MNQECVSCGVVKDLTCFYFADRTFSKRRDFCDTCFEERWIAILANDKRLIDTELYQRCKLCIQLKPNADFPTRPFSFCTVCHTALTEYITTMTNTQAQALQDALTPRFVAGTLYEAPLTKAEFRELIALKLRRCCHCRVIKPIDDFWESVNAGTQEALLQGTITPTYQEQTALSFFRRYGYWNRTTVCKPCESRRWTQRRLSRTPTVTTAPLGPVLDAPVSAPVAHVPEPEPAPVVVSNPVSVWTAPLVQEKPSQYRNKSLLSWVRTEIKRLIGV